MSGAAAAEVTVEHACVFLFFPTRPKKLRFHPKQLYTSAKQAELKKVVLMLGTLAPPPPKQYWIRSDPRSLVLVGGGQSSTV